MNPHEVFIHIHQGCFAGTGAIVRLPQCQWSKPNGYGKISQCITTTKHSKAKTVCIFLGIYCTWLYRNQGRVFPSMGIYIIKIWRSLYNWNPYTGKTATLYWDEPQGSVCIYACIYSSEISYTWDLCYCDRAAMNRLFWLRGNANTMPSWVRVLMQHNIHQTAICNTCGTPFANKVIIFVDHYGM